MSWRFLNYINNRYKDDRERGEADRGEHTRVQDACNGAYSHGCIRLAAPRKLADYVLEPMPEWTKDRTDSLLATGMEQTVKLGAPVPVLICYFTAWVSGDGVLLFRKDIYGHDSAMARKLFY